MVVMSPVAAGVVSVGVRGIVQSACIGATTGDSAMCACNSVVQRYSMLAVSVGVVMIRAIMRIIVDEARVKGAGTGAGKWWVRWHLPVRDERAGKQTTRN